MLMLWSLEDANFYLMSQSDIIERLTIDNIVVYHMIQARKAMLSIQKAKALPDKLKIGKSLEYMFWEFVHLGGQILQNILSPELPAVAEFSTGETMGHSGDRLAAAFNVSRK